METGHLCLFMIVCLGVHGSEIVQRQKRSWIIESFTIDEGYKGSFPYSLGVIESENDLTLFQIHGQGVDEEPRDVLQIDRYTGEVTVHGPVDYERFKVFKLIFEAFDSDKNLMTRLHVEIQITDANDNPPRFDAETTETSIQEATLQGTGVIFVKANDADNTENYGLFDLKIVSVTPRQQDVEFYLNHIRGSQTGTISFKGCLDYEKAEKYTIVVEAKDHGDEVQLSSSCTIIINIEDGNNHRPEITGQTGPGRAKEGEEHVLVSRLQVTDGDAKGTAAWRAKYRIQEDADSNFKITTDPETNEGLLYVEKGLDYEDSRLKSVTVTVENEIPHHSCKVVSRRATGLWEIVTADGAGSRGTTGTERSTQRVTVTVDDVNEPPIFDERQKQVTLTENIEAGHYLGTFSAKDPDISSANRTVYIKGDDPAGWITVDRVSGEVTTSQALDRESHYVTDSMYKATVYAVDDGKPPMTSTATLSIQINDENDNAPGLNASAIVMCQSDGESLAIISVFDLDAEPYDGPFHFKLLGDAEGEWRVEPNQGYWAHLVKEVGVHSGQFQLVLEVSDLQHKAAWHNLSVTVCSCLDGPEPLCHSPKGAAVGGAALWVIFAAMLLLAGMLLLACLLSCEAANKMLPDESSEQHLMNSNTETPGSDCEVWLVPSGQTHSQNVNHSRLISDVSAAMQKQSFNTAAAAAAAAAPASQAHSLCGMSQNEQLRGNYSYQIISDQQQRQGIKGNEFSRGNSLRMSMVSSSAMRKRRLDGHSENRRWMGGKNNSAGQVFEFAFELLNRKLSALQAPGEELGDYAPRVYAEEGYSESGGQLDAISIPDASFEPGLELNYKFSTLASICRPPGSPAAAQGAAL